MLKLYRYLMDAVMNLTCCEADMGAPYTIPALEGEKL